MTVFSLLNMMDYYLPPLDFWVTAGPETEATWDTHTGSRAWMNGVGRKVGAPRQWYIVFSIPYSTSVILQSTKIHYSRLFVNDKSLCGLLTWYYVVQSQHSRVAGKYRDGRDWSLTKFWKIHLCSFDPNNAKISIIKLLTLTCRIIMQQILYLW